METKNMRKLWVSEYITTNEIKNKETPKERIIIINGEGEIKDRKAKNSDTIFTELHLPVLMDGNERKLKLGQWEEKLFDYLSQNLGSDTKEWVNASVMLTYEKKGDYPVLGGVIVKHPITVSGAEVLVE